MIGFLRGRLAAKHPPQLLVDVGGVGYEVEAPMSTFYTLPPTGGDVNLFTHLVVREDAHILFGFGTERERKLFRELLKVSNVGPKLALSLLCSVVTYVVQRRGMPEAGALTLGARLANAVVSSARYVQKLVAPVVAST